MPVQFKLEAFDAVVGQLYCIGLIVRLKRVSLFSLSPGLQLLWNGSVPSYFHSRRLGRNPTELNRKLSNFNFQSEQKPCTRIIWSVLHSFLHFSRAKDVITHLQNWHQRKFLMRARENKCQISQNFILHMKFSELYVCFHNSWEIWHSFSRTAMRNFLWCYYRWLITSLGLNPFSTTNSSCFFPD